MRGGPHLNWGILAPGFIAGKFAAALHTHTDHRILSVASRDPQRAEAFSREHGISHAHHDYRALVDDPQISAVYIAAPHTEHRPLAELAIAAGKHVLIEKPLAHTAADARAIRDAAAAAGVFAMEAMHSRFHPRTTVIEQLLVDGVLGELTSASAELGVAFPVDYASRLFDPALGGGGMLDLGVYCVWFTRFALGAPSAIHAHGTLTETGVDAQASVTMFTPSAALATVTTSMLSWLPSLASINGKSGRIHVTSRHPLPGGFVLVDASNRPYLEFSDTSGIALQDGLCRQAVWMAQHVSDGLLDSPLHPLDMAIGQLETIDEVRHQLGNTAVDRRH